MLLCVPVVHFLNISKYIHSIFNIHMDYFKFLVFVNDAAINILLYVTWFTYAHISIGYTHT